MRFILASASPARLATLQGAGIEPEVIVSGFDESSVTAESTAELVQLLANAKAKVVSEGISGEAVVLGCDSMFEFEGTAMGKPVTDDETRSRWRRMRGRSGILYTGHCLIDKASERAILATVATVVRFADVTDDEIEWYINSGEPANVAGGFTIDGFGGWFVAGVEGDHTNVIGVSLPTVRRMLRELGVLLEHVSVIRPLFWDVPPAQRGEFEV